MDNAQRADPGSVRRLCVVLHAAGEGPDAALVRALGRKNLMVVGTDNAHEALARVCNDTREGRKTILVLDGEDQPVSGVRIVDAMDRYAPGAVCWDHEPGANPPIRPVVGTLGSAIDAVIDAGTDSGKPSPSQPEPLVSQPVQSSVKDPPELRLTKQAPSASRPRAAVSAKDVLNADELDALLASEMPPGKNNGV